MEDFNFDEYVKMVKSFQEKDDPTGWFDSIYKNANGDYKKVFWADLEPSPYLVEWLEKNPLNKKNKKACVIGCGVGDDAQALSEFGFDVTAFDISPSAIELCINRYPNTKVDYIVADLFDYPKEWFEKFDVVYECNTIQVLPGVYRHKARDAMSSLICKDGYILVSCRSRNEGEKQDAIPLPLTKKEIDNFKTINNLKELSFLAYDDNQEPSVPHFFAVYKK
ncbi:methyltransferase type 12 [Malaciobacter pacificus]|uniref:SAM-dependent methyltransferase n=1 Tax=Malaciobacter pacificus TaxID=1080223 RepID=A0A5C2H4U3_9BACT|nr:class I SAM-dependent methyltransferase [Malaciobacter pacificus]QEP34017.1 SAM-dependent methyltransferase [Malaciobacter pacificus]GGD35864.1 methyltransferase type 12 [Malaciobacter pacificus]